MKCGENMGAEYKNAIRLLNRLFDDNSFLHELADYSNNNYQLLLTNISKIITYYLYTEDQRIYPVNELISRADSLRIEYVKYIMMPSNKAYHTHITLHGVNGKKSNIEDMLTLLSENVSFYGYPRKVFETPLFSEPTGAVSSTLEYPSILFKDILKRPFNRDDINPEESEKTYYESILKDRLDNVDRFNYEKCARVARRVMNTFIPNRPMMIVISADDLKKIVSQEDINRGSSMERIPSRYLSYLFLPSKYELLKLCYKEKKIVEEEPEIEYSYGYGRYEVLTIDDNFRYEAGPFTGLTGDPLYDIDSIYGKENSDDKRFDRDASITDNLYRIKRNHDINVTRMNGYYRISNGRHRLLYLLNTYINFKRAAKSQADIEYIKHLCSIPVRVVNHIEDKTFNEIIRSLGSTYRLGVFKNDIRNDDPDIYLSISNLVFHLRSVDELKELYNGLEDHYVKRKYYVGRDINPEDKEEYRALFASLAIRLQERIFDMSFEQILSFFPEKDLNYLELYNEYRIMVDKVSYSRIVGIENDYLKRAEKTLHYGGSSTKK
jgi:hypothetical protein